MKKKLSLIGIFFLSMIVFTGCQKNDDEIPVEINEETLAQQIDYEQAKEILNSNMANLSTVDISNDTELKSTVQYNGNLFRIVLDYDDDPCVAVVNFTEYSRKVIDDSNVNIKFYVLSWFYINGEWILKSSRLCGGAIALGENIGNWYLSPYNYELVSAQIIVYKYIEGQQPVYSGITDGIQFRLKEATCPY